MTLPLMPAAAVSTDPPLLRACQDILATATAALDPKPARSLIQVGSQVAWDECECGQLAVRVVSKTPVNPRSRRGGGNAGVSTLCGPVAWDARLGISIIRCVDGMSDDGSPPKDRVITADASVMLADEWALEKALQGLEVAGAVGVVQLTTWNALGPEGQCAGGEWTAGLRVGACAPADDDSTA